MWKLICRGLKLFAVNLLESETVDQHLVGVSNSPSSTVSVFLLIFVFDVVISSLYFLCHVVMHQDHEPLPGEIICPRDQRRRQSANVS